MSDADGGKNGDKPQNTPPNNFPEKITVVYDRQPFDKIADAIDEKKGRQNEATNNNNTVANRQADAQETGNEIYRDSNKISRTSNYISFGVCFATICLFFLNWCSTKAAIQAANAADANMKITYNYDTASLNKQEKSFQANQNEIIKRDSVDSVNSKAQNEVFASNYRLAEKNLKTTTESNKKTLEAQILAINISDSNNKKSIELSKQLVQAQIESIKESQEEFTIVNEPYLQIDSPYVSDFRVGHNLAINFSVENLGKYPVKVDSFKIYFHIAPNPFPLSILQGKEGYNLDQPVNTYITSGKNFPFAVQSNDLNQVADTIFIKYPNNWLVYFVGFIRYENLITGTKKTYVFELALLPNTKKWKFIFNDNFRMKPTP